MRDSRKSFRFVAVSAVAALTLAVSACGSSDDDDNEVKREASTSATLAWSGQTGNSFGDYKGVQLDVTSRFADSAYPVEMSVAAEGKTCDEDQYGNTRCLNRSGGTSLRDIPPQQRAEWKSTGEILFEAANSQQQWKSELRWPVTIAGQHEGYAQIVYSVLNPFARKPRFVIQARSSRGTSCLAGSGDNVIDLTEGASRTLADKEVFCQVEMTISRLTDSADFKRFNVVVKPNPSGD